MSSQSPSTEPQPRIADRLAAARRGRFVGRQAELVLFRDALLADEPPFAVLHLHGPGGVGKTTLLREYARIASECGRAVVRLDGRDLESSPAGFLRALRRALGQEEGVAHDALPGWPSNGVLLVDTYETLAGLDAWLRETFVPQLPARSVVVLAGRNAPAPAWRTDLDWADLAAIVPLRNLRPEESQTYLAARGIPAARYADALAFTHGHPLALALVADALGRGEEPGSFDPASEPEVVRILLERLVRDVPDARHRQALEVCVLARVTTERMLAEVLREDDARDLFEWLRQLTFVEQGQYGLFPHDLAREVLEADARWRDLAGFQRLGWRINRSLQARIARSSGVEQQRLQLEALFALRADPAMEGFFNLDALEGVYAESATAADVEAIIAMVRAHEGDESAAIARHWLERQPQAFWVFRAGADEPFGFMAHLALHLATPEDIAADPAAIAALAFVRRYGPAAPGEEVMHLRFQMHRQVYQTITVALNLTAMTIVTHVLTRPNMAWNFVTFADPDFWQPHFTGLNWPRASEADFTVGGRRYGVFAHDWRIGPAATWMSKNRPLMPFDPAYRQAPVSPGLSRDEFGAAVRQALRDYTRPDRLAVSPLLRSRLVGGTPEALRARLREATEALTANPRDLKLHRALWHTYFEPAPTQEAAAELLGLPFNTYRYQLANGIERVAEWLWRREQEAAR
jgi:predicted acetyltransferase/energy-coupling factor transporter ATP-binding protein EcfA2